MKAITISITLLSLLILFSLQPVHLNGEPDEILREVGNLTGRAEYSKVLSLLSKAIRTHAASPQRRDLYIKALGDFFKDVCGDMNKARMNYRRVVNGTLPVDHPVKQSARWALKSMGELESGNRDKNAHLKTLKSRSTRKRDIKAVEEDIKALKTFIGNNSEYYLLHEAWYALGMNYNVMGKHGKVYDALVKAMEIKPGVIFYLPVKHRAEKAYDAYLRETVNTVTRVGLWVLLMSAMIVFYRSKPWRWLGLKHVIILVLLLISWWLVFTVSHTLVGKAFEHRYENLSVKPHEMGKDIEFQRSLPGSPGSEVSDLLFWFGVTGVIAVFIFSITIKNFGGKKWTAVIAATFGFLLFLGLSSLFYMNYCDSGGEFKPGGKGLAYYLWGGVHFKSDTPEPFILTEPLSYPSLDTANMTDPYLRDWIIKHCPSPRNVEQKQ